jgi:hypothetical protein
MNGRQQEFQWYESCVDGGTSVAKAEEQLRQTTIDQLCTAPDDPTDAMSEGAVSAKSRSGCRSV